MGMIIISCAATLGKEIEFVGKKSKVLQPLREISPSLQIKGLRVEGQSQAVNASYSNFFVLNNVFFLFLFFFSFSLKVEQPELSPTEFQDTKPKKKSRKEGHGKNQGHWPGGSFQQEQQNSGRATISM